MYLGKPKNGKWASQMAQCVKNSPANVGDRSSNPGSGRFPLERKWQPAPVFLPRKSHRQRSLGGGGAGGVPQSTGSQSQTGLSD